MAIVLVRIDDRLIHGQVAWGWSKMTNASVIVVPDDEAASDPVQKSLLKAGTPIGIRSAILGVADAAALLKGPKITNERTLVIVRGPASVVGLLDNGVDIKKVIVGNMRGETGKKRITKESAVNEAEWNSFKELDARGIELTIQWIPGSDTKNLNEILKKQSFESL